MGSSWSLNSFSRTPSVMKNAASSSVIGSGSSLVAPTVEGSTGERLEETTSIVKALRSLGEFILANSNRRTYREPRVEKKETAQQGSC
eukprot:m.81791 g.81791  ORF g.81791 m.81791 type:complete len:88 (+) comp11032_c0_seq2:2214-2477(+)